MQRARTVEERLEAVERALTDEDLSVAAVADEAGREKRLRSVEERLDDVEASLEDAEAAVEALRGYVGEIRHVNEEVERTANAAVAAVERLDVASGAPPPIAHADPVEPSEVASTSPTESTAEESGDSLVDRLRSHL